MHRVDDRASPRARGVVLVTGGTGLIGRHALAPLVARGFRVHGVSRDRVRDFTSEVVWHQGDILSASDRERMIAEARFTHLLHLAWVTDHGKFWHSPENGRWVEASMDLVDRFRARGGRRVVLAGTCAEYDWQAELGSNDCGEHTTAATPHTPYGRAKLQLAEWLFALHGMSCASGRVFFVFGEDEIPERLVPSVATRLLKGVPAPVGPGTQVRDLLDARDAGSAFAALLDSDVRGWVNVGSGQGVTLAEVVRALGETIGRPELVQLGSLPSRPDDPPRLVADVARLRDQVGFRPRHTLREGLDHAVKWWASRVGTNDGFLEANER